MGLVLSMVLVAVADVVDTEMLVVTVGPGVHITTVQSLDMKVALVQRVALAALGIPMHLVAVTGAEAVVTNLLVGQVEFQAAGVVALAMPPGLGA